MRDACVCACVRACVRACVCVRGVERKSYSLHKEPIRCISPPPEVGTIIMLVAYVRRVFRSLHEYLNNDHRHIMNGERMIYQLNTNQTKPPSRGQTSSSLEMLSADRPKKLLMKGHLYSEEKVAVLFFSSFFFLFLL